MAFDDVNVNLINTRVRPVAEIMVELQIELEDVYQRWSDYGGGVPNDTTVMPEVRSQLPDVTGAEITSALADLNAIRQLLDDAKMDRFRKLAVRVRRGVFGGDGA